MTHGSPDHSRCSSRARSPVVSDISRKVIRRLEGLRHPDMVDVYPPPEDDTDVPSSNVSDGEREREQTEAEYEWAQVEKVLYDQLNLRHGHGHIHDHPADIRHESSRANGAAANGQVDNESGKRRKVDWEIPRKLLHSSIGFFTLYLYITESQISRVVFVLWSSLCIIVPADLLRFRSPAFEKLYERFLGFLMRESEKNSVNGVVWYILGVNFTLQFYPRDIATVAILILSWADTAASTIGRLYGPSSPRLPSHLALPHPSLPLIKIPLASRKSYAGFVAASVTGAMIAMGFWAWIGPWVAGVGGSGLSWDFAGGVKSPRESGAWTGVLTGWLGLGVIGVVTGLVSGVAEAMDLGSLDDNLTLPIISGGCIFGFLRLVGWIGESFTRWTS